LDLPKQILSEGSSGAGNLIVQRTGTLATFSSYKMSYTQSLSLERSYGSTAPISFLANPGGYPTTFATWSRPTDMILLAFFDESFDTDNAGVGTTDGYHGVYTKDWQSYNGGVSSTTYTTDYNDFVNYVSPLTGNPLTKLNSFTGILYPVVKGENLNGEYIGDILNTYGASLVIQGVSAIYGTTLSVAEIEAIPGLSTDTTLDYPGEPFASIVDNDTSGWTDGWSDINATILTTFNPYTGLKDSQDQRGFRDALIGLGYTVRTKILKEFYDDSSGRYSQKANLDIEIVVDMFNTVEQYDRVILLSGDGDFERAIELLRSKNTHITVVSTEGMIARELRNATDRYIDLNDIREQIEKTDPS
jgi:uncharacterized LabA/DUF88 family protein